MPSSLRPIRRLGLEDLKACLALSADREWAAEERKWALLLDAAESYGIDDPDGALTGAVVLARYGPGPLIAVIAPLTATYTPGTIFCHGPPDRRRCSRAASVRPHAIAWLRAITRCWPSSVCSSSSQSMPDARRMTAE
jgi:hypothetical protein